MNAVVPVAAWILVASFYLIVVYALLELFRERRR